MILCIESATEICSIGLADKGELMALAESPLPRSHTEKITLLIEQCLKEAGALSRDLKAVAVSIGPGSYTSLRIGLSTAKGLCYALNIPLISIDTLQIIAQIGVGESEGADIIPMLDARRMEVYQARFTATGHRISQDIAQIIDSDWLASLSPGSILCGNGAHKVEELSPSHPFSIKDGRLSARLMTHLADEKYELADFADLAYSSPNYIKPVRIIKSKKKLL